MSQEEEINKLLDEADKLEEKQLVDEAIKNLEKALQISNEFYGQEHANIANIYLKLGHLMAYTVFPGLAFPYFEKTLAIILKISGSEYVSNFCFEQGIFSEKKAFSEAVKYFIKRSTEFNPKNAIAWNKLGDLKYDLNDYSGAILNYSKAILIAPEYIEALNNRGNAKYKLENYQEAIEDYSNALKVSPDYVKALNNRGHSKAELEDYQGAIEDFTQSINISPKDFGIWNQRGISKIELKDYQGAILDFSEAININSLDYESWRNRAFVKSLINDFQGAINDFSEAIKINPEDEDVWFERGNAKTEIQDYLGAINDYTEAIWINPKDEYVWKNRGNAKTELKDYQGAINDYTEAISINPKDKYAWFDRGNAKYDIKEYQGAIEDYSNAINIDPKIVEIWFNRGCVKIDLHDYQGAINDFSGAIKINADLVEVWVNRGITKAKMNDYQGAIEDLTQAIYIKPEDILAWCNRGYTKQNNRDYLGALDDYSQAITLNSEYALAWYNRGTVYYELGNLEKSLIDFKMIINFFEESQGGKEVKLTYSFAYISSIYFIKGNHQDALFYSQKAFTERNPGLPMGYDNNPNLQISDYRNKLWSRILFIKAACLYLLREQDQNYLNYCLNTYLLAFKMNDAIRFKIKSFTEKLEFQNELDKIKRQSLLAANEWIKAEDSRIEDFFRFSEKLKSSIFFEAVNLLNSIEFSKINHELVEEYYKLVKEITLLQSLPQMTGIDEKINPEEEELHISKLYSELDNVLMDIKTNFPEEYGKLLAPPQTIELDELQTSLDVDTVMLIYSFSEGTLFISSITCFPARINEVPLDDDFYDDLNGFYNSMANKDLNFITRGYACRLFEKLIKPVSDLIQYNINKSERVTKRLVIIPDGPLYMIPFEALYFSQEFPNDESQIPYLVKEYTITYHYSASLWAESIKRSGSNTDLSSFLGFAPVFENKPRVPETKAEDGNKIKPETEEGVNPETQKPNPLKSFSFDGKIVELPDSDKEITESAMLYNPLGKPFRKEEAIKARFMEEANRYKICHLSTHGYYDVANPAESGIWFYTDGKEDKGKCFLYAGELYNMDLKGVELFILSACETHLDDTKEGEGFIGLTRGAHAAGARNVVASKWKVQNAATIELMVGFHRNINIGMSYGEALREAKTALLRTSEYAHPFYWASFVLNGVGGNLSTNLNRKDLSIR